jgi:hypothetical protein
MKLGGLSKNAFEAYGEFQHYYSPPFKSKMKAQSFP